MSAEYRLLHADEADAAADLWAYEHEDPGLDTPQHQAWRRQFRTIPHLLTHTWVAVAPDGTLLSIAHYWPLLIHDADGVPQRIGRISHVFTRADARRRGHAARLLELMIAAMQDEGCLWSMLSASDEGRPLYEGYGWRALPLRRVSWVPSGQRRKLPPRYAVCPYDPEHEAGGWAIIQQIHLAYNRGRPLTTVRDGDYWRHQVENIRWWRSTGSAALLVATEIANERIPRAYALVYHRRLRPRLSLLETGTQTGHEEALLSLLSAITHPSDSAITECSLCLPHDPTLEAALAALSTQIEYRMGGDCMVRAIAPSFDTLALETLPSAPGAVLWDLDDI